MTSLFVAAEVFPVSHLDMKRTDWEIVKAFRRDPRRSPSEVANEAGISTRTVKRRLTAVTENSSIFKLLPGADTHSLSNTRSLLTYFDMFGGCIWRQVRGILRVTSPYRDIYGKKYPKALRTDHPRTLFLKIL